MRLRLDKNKKKIFEKIYLQHTCLLGTVKPSFQLKENDHGGKDERNEEQRKDHFRLSLRGGLK